MRLSKHIESSYLIPHPNRYDAFLALALAAFFLLLLIMTMLKKDPTTAEPSKVRMTGIRIAQTRGGKRLWSGWPSSTKGCEGQLVEIIGRILNLP